MRALLGGIGVRVGRLSKKRETLLTGRVAPNVSQGPKRTKGSWMVNPFLLNLNVHLLLPFDGIPGTWVFRLELTVTLLTDLLLKSLGFPE